MESIYTTDYYEALGPIEKEHFFTQRALTDRDPSDLPDNIIYT